MLWQNKSPGVHLVLLTAYGITKEPVASNRIYGLASGLSGVVDRLTVIGVDYPGQTEHDYGSLGKHVKVVSVKPGFFSSKARSIARGLKKGKKAKPAPVGSPALNEERSVGMMRKVYRTLMFVFTAEGYLVPVARLFLEALKEVRRSLASGHTPVVFSTTGPPCVVVISSLLKKILGKRVVLVNDFRDPVFENPYIKKEALAGILKGIERFAVRNADAVTSVSSSCLKSLAERPRRFYVLYNGYLGLSAERRKGGDVVPLSLGYFGAVYSARTESLRSLARAIRGTGFKFYYAGKHAGQVESVFEKEGALEELRVLGLLSKEEALEWLSRMQVLLVLKTDEDRGVIPGKFYECIVTDKPVLVIGDSDSEFNEIARRIGGTFVVPKNPERIRQELLNLKNTTGVSRNEREVVRFDWKNLSRAFLDDVLLRLVSEIQ